MLPAPCGQATLASHDERYRAVAWRCANERTFARFPHTFIVHQRRAPLAEESQKAQAQSSAGPGRVNAARRLVGWGMKPVAAAGARPPAHPFGFLGGLGPVPLGSAAP